MTKFKIIGLGELLYQFQNKKGNTVNNSSSLLLPISSSRTHLSVKNKNKNSFVMAIKKLKHCLLLKSMQYIVAVCVLFMVLGQADADARKFQPSGDNSINIITDPKSVASIDFR